MRSNRHMNYLISKRIHSTEREVIDQMDTDCHDVAVEFASVSVDAGSHAM